MDPIQYGLRLVLLGALFGSGCNRAAPPPPPPPASPFRPVADVRQLMSAVIEPAAEIYWDAVGTVVDKSGTVEIEPKTDDEWIAVRNSAYVVAEAGNLLMMDTRARNSGDWMTLSQALVEVGQRAVRAAESRNKAAVFDAGAEVYDACVACHAKYALPAMRPNAAGGSGS